MSRSLSIDDLAVRAQQGDTDCFARIVELERNRLTAFLRKRTTRQSDADDLVQETFERAFSKLHQYDARWRFSTWLFTIASNLAATQSHAQRPHQQLEDTMACVTSGADRVEARHDGRQMWQKAQQCLSAAHYEVLWLRYAMGLSVREIADATGRTTVHTKVILYRIRRRLAEEI